MNKRSTTLPQSLYVAFAVLAFQSSTRAEALRYNFQPKEVVVYKLNIVANSPSSKDSMTGLIAYTGKSSGEKQFSLEYRGHLNRKTQSRNRRRGPGGPPGFGGRRGPGGPPGFGRGVTFGGLSRTTNQLVVSKTGKVLKLSGQSQLPYLLGNLSILPFEALPSAEQQAWEVGTGISITEEEESPFFGGPFRGNTTTESGGSENAAYKIQSDDGRLVKIEKTYRLIAPAATKNDEAIEINGTGLFTFNRELGVPESLDMKQTYLITEAGSKVSIPMTISWIRVETAVWEKQESDTAERIAKMKQELAERQARSAAAAKEAAGKKLAPDEKAKIMADLNSTHWPAQSNRLNKMSRFEPHPDDFDIALKIKELQSSKIASVYLTARKIWPRLEKLIDAHEAEMSTAAVDNPFATKGEKTSAAARGMREWSDSTGSFKVDAEFVRFDAGGIVLKRKDGKELTVPLDKLSDADKRVSAALKAAPATAAPENPFE